MSPAIDLSRVVVVGTSGAGKTVLARALAEILCAPHVELDALHWGPDWSVRADFAAQAALAAAQSRWVIDGNYRAMLSERVWPRATAFVWLNYSFRRVFARALVRTVLRVVRGERLWANNRESLQNTFFDRKSILWWIITTYARRRREYRLLFARPEFASVHIVELTHPGAAEAFIRELKCGRDGDADGGRP